MKLVSEYTDKELIEIGRKTVQVRIEAAEAEKEKRILSKKLLDLYKAGKIKI